MRVVFMGTPAFSVRVLQAIADAGHEIAAVYSQPPRPAGRGKKDRKSPVHDLAEENGWPVHTPLNFKDTKDLEIFAAHKADVAVVVAYGLILPQPILDAPKLGCLNVHASLLPRWRGAAPIQRAIEAGDAQTGVCIMQMDAGLDTGPEILRVETTIDEDTTYASLHDTLADLGANALVKVLDQGRWTATPQSGEGITYAHKIDKAEAQIDWSLPAQTVAQKIRAFSPFPGAFTTRDGERLKILMAKRVKGANKAGTLVAAPLVVSCGFEAVDISKVQPSGKPAMDAKSYLNGKPMGLGDRFD